jgi:hypothetical protein
VLGDPRKITIIIQYSPSVSGDLNTGPPKQEVQLTLPQSAVSLTYYIAYSCYTACPVSAITNSWILSIRKPSKNKSAFRISVYCPQTRRWSLTGMRQIRMRKISWCKTSYCYPSWKHSQGALAHCTPLEMPDVSSPCAVEEHSLSLLPTAAPHLDSSPPPCDRHPPPPPSAWIISWSVVCKLFHSTTSLLQLHKNWKIYIYMDSA